MAINKDKLSANIEARMEELAQELTLALAEYYDWWLSHYPAQTLYGFCLYSSPLVEYLGVTLFTEEGLTAVAKKYQNDKSFRHKSLTQLKQTLRWSACDSHITTKMKIFLRRLTTNCNCCKKTLRRSSPKRHTMLTLKPCTPY